MMSQRVSITSPTTSQFWFRPLIPPSSKHVESPTRASLLVRGCKHGAKLHWDPGGFVGNTEENGKVVGGVFFLNVSQTGRLFCRFTPADFDGFLLLCASRFTTATTTASRNDGLLIFTAIPI